MKAAGPMSYWYHHTSKDSRDEIQAAPVCCRLALCQAGRSSHSDTSSFPGGLLISECQGLGRSRAGAEQQLSEADQPRGPQIGPFVFPGDTSLTLDLTFGASPKPTCLVPCCGSLTRRNNRQRIPWGRFSTRPGGLKSRRTRSPVLALPHTTQVV
jgi:hypothetical protein